MKFLRSISRLALLAAGLILPVFSVHSAIVVVAPTGSSTGSLTITQDITFTITTGVSSGNLIFVLDEWVTSDGTNTSDTFSSLARLSFAVNGVAAPQSVAGSIHDNFTGVNVALTPNDGYIEGELPHLAAGDTVTLKADTYTLPAVGNFNPQATQTFTGDMFIATDVATKISNTVSAVPEPGSAASAPLHWHVGSVGHAPEPPPRDVTSLQGS